MKRGEATPRWFLPTHKLTVCYELSRDFAELYRDYGDVRADGTRTADNSKRKSIDATPFKPSRQQTHRKRKASR